MRILTAFGILFLLLAGAGWWLTHIDWEHYRPELAAQISGALGAEVKLNGRLSIAFFPYPKLAAEDAELTASGIDIQAPHLKLTAKLWPLLRGRVILSSADIVDPKITINPQLWQAPRAAQDNISRTKVRLEDVEIQNGEFDITFGQNHEVMTEIDMQLRAPDWHGPYQADADFIWHGQEWELTSQLGIKTAAGTRPANFTLKQNDGTHQFSWRGAVQAVPLALHGDGQWQSAADKLNLQAQVDVTDQIMQMTQGILYAGNKTLGSVNGRFMIGANVWQNLDANLTEASPGWLRGLSLIPLDSVWHKFGAAGALQFHLQNGALTNLKFAAPEITAVYNHAHWHLWGRDAADALALWGHPDIHVWPNELAAAFDAKLAETKDGTQIETLRIGKLQSHGMLTAAQLELQTESLGWLSADTMDAWRAVLRELGLQKFALHAHQWDLAPLSSGDSKMILTLNKNADHLALQTPAFHVSGEFQDDNFKGRLDCQNNHLLRIFHAGCGSAQIVSDDNQWQFTAEPADNEKWPSKWHGLIDFAAATWNLHMPFSRGEISAEGKLGQNDFHMNVADFGLAEFLQIFLPSAQRADGDISAQLHVTADKAEGDLTASNLQLPALNLLLDNPAQPGKIATLTTKINWQGDVLELPQLHTTGPDGNGHASVNLDSASWHGDWAEARGNNHVAIDGPADSVPAQRYRFTETARP